MTWTDINPEKMAEYDGMTPTEIGREIYKVPIHILKSQEDSLRWIPNREPWNYHIDSEEWGEFWESVYALKDIPEYDWSDDQWYAYKALGRMTMFALMKS